MQEAKPVTKPRGILKKASNRRKVRSAKSVAWARDDAGHIVTMVREIPHKSDEEDRYNAADMRACHGDDDQHSFSNPACDLHVDWVERPHILPPKHERQPWHAGIGFWVCSLTFLALVHPANLEQESSKLVNRRFLHVRKWEYVRVFKCQW